MRCLAPNLWGWLGDVSGRRLEIVRLGALCTLLSFGLIFFDKSFAWLALVMALHAFFWHAVLPQFEVITLAHLHEQPERYSQVRLWGSIGFILAVVGRAAVPAVESGPVSDRCRCGDAGHRAEQCLGPERAAAQPRSAGQGGFLAQLRRPAYWPSTVAWP